jgi:hypothetical protein
MSIRIGETPLERKEADLDWPGRHVCEAMAFTEIDEATRQAVLEQLLDMNAWLEVTGLKRERSNYLVRKGSLAPAKRLTNGDLRFWLSDVLRIRDEEFQEEEAESDSRRAHAAGVSSYPPSNPPSNPPSVKRVGLDNGT